jgi:hypothetical protein
MKEKINLGPSRKTESISKSIINKPVINKPAVIRPDPIVSLPAEDDYIY